MTQAPLYVIYTLPSARRQYDIHTVDLEPDSQEICYICYRIFNEKDDPTDTDEIPCRPLQLQPCKHLVGSECFTRMIQANMTACQICRTQVTPLSDVFPRWLQTATSWSWYTLYADYTPGYASKTGKLEIFRNLSQRLFEGRPLTFAELSRLWWFYMDSLAAWTRTVLMFALFIIATFTTTAWLTGAPFAELQIIQVLSSSGVVVPYTRIMALALDVPLMVALGFVARWRDNFAVERGPSGLEVCMLFLAARVFALAFSIVGFCAVLALNWVAYGSLTAALIWYGLKGPEGLQAPMVQR
jgi:hypothetical protein